MNVETCIIRRILLLLDGYNVQPDHYSLPQAMRIILGRQFYIVLMYVLGFNRQVKLVGRLKPE